MSRLWIIAYDIADDRRRRILAAALSNHAERVQESVFEAWLSPVGLQQLVHEIRLIIDLASDTVRIYPLSGNTPARRSVLGAMPVTADTPCFWAC